MQKIIIDEEFKALLPALDEKTYTMLEENLLENGCRDALILWGDILIDGYNRYDICSKHDIPYKIVVKEFASREEVLIWIITNQVSRRNLTQTQLSYYRGLHYRADKKLVTNERGTNQSTKPVERQIDVQPEKQPTAARLAGQYHVSAKTIERDNKASLAIDAIGESSPETKTKILSGDYDVSKRELERIAGMNGDDLDAVIADIEEGINAKYAVTRRAAVEHAANNNRGEDRTSTEVCPAALTRLDRLISNLAANLCTRLRKMKRTGELAEMKPAFKAFIYALEEMYSEIPEVG